MSDSNSTFAGRFVHEQEALAARIGKSAELLGDAKALDEEWGGQEPGGLAFGDAAAELGVLRDALDRPYRLVVAGVQNAGKSTLVNVLLGRWLMPSRARNVDAVLSALHWSESERAEVHYLSGESRRVELSDALELLDQISEHRAQEQARVDYVAIGLPDANLRTVSLVNTPGLNDRPVVSRRTEAFFAEADAIVWIFDSSKVEEATIAGAVLDLCRLHGHKLIAVLNRVDEVEKMGGPTAMADVEARFKALFHGCYEACFRLNAKGAAVGLGIHPGAKRHTPEQRKSLLDDSGFSGVFEHFDENYFGRDKRKEKLDGAEKRARAVLEAVHVRIRSHVAKTETADAQRASQRSEFARLHRKAMRTGTRIDRALADIAEEHINKLIGVHLGVCGRVAEDTIGLRAIVQGEKVAAEFQEALQREVEAKYPQALFLQTLSQSVESVIIEGWLDFAEESEQEFPELSLDLPGVAPAVGANVSVGKALGPALTALLRTGLNIALKKGGERLARKGFKRVVQKAVRAVAERIAKMLGKRFTVTLLRQVAKYVNPILWLTAVLDVGKVKREISDGLAKARADVESELSDQRWIMAEQLAEQLYAVHHQVREPIIEALSARLDEADRSGEATATRRAELNDLADQLRRIWTEGRPGRDPSSASRDESRVDSTYEQWGAEPE